jgi:hypothetical protein
MTEAQADAWASLQQPEAYFTAQMIWQQLHGIVSLRITRPRFPWPPLEETVTTAVGRLLGPLINDPERAGFPVLPKGTA